MTRILLLLVLMALPLAACDTLQSFTDTDDQTVDFGSSPDSIKDGCRIDARQKVKAAGPVQGGYDTALAGGAPTSDWELENDEYLHCLRRHGVTSE